MAIATEDIVADGYGTETSSPVQVHPLGNGYNVIYEADERGCFKRLRRAHDGGAGVAHHWSHWQVPHRTCGVVADGLGTGCSVQQNDRWSGRPGWVRSADADTPTAILLTRRRSGNRCSYAGRLNWVSGRSRRDRQIVVRRMARGHER